MAPSAAEIARHFPQLEVLELLGQGGMGAVYKARQIKLDRLVAVKIIRPETTGDPAFAERFMREARTLARLSHSGIVAVHDFGEVNAPEIVNAVSSSGKLFYFIMEYVDGANLRQLMEAGQLSPELAVTIVPQVCDALQYAHDEGVVHRDIKPENILLDSRGRVKIADFGLAKLGGPAAEQWTLTGTHQVMGTPRYMAPEQMAGSREVDHRADIYSLGVVFYEMLTGTVPVGHFAPPSQKSTVDIRLDDVVLKAMASEPERRFQAARELRSSVEKISSPSVQPATGSLVGKASRETGFSTIIDREVLGAWRLMSGSGETFVERSTAMPVLFMLVLCLVGGLGSLLPWFNIEFTETAVAEAANDFLASGTPRDVIDYGAYLSCQASAGPRPDSGIVWNPKNVYLCHGTDLNLGFISVILFGSLALAWLLTPQRYRLSIPLTSVAVILSAILLLSVLFARLEIQNLPFRLTSSAGVSPASVKLSEPGLLTWQACLYLQDADSPPGPPVADSPPSSQVTDGSSEVFSGPLRTIRPQPGYFLVLGVAALLLVLNGSGLRWAVFDGERQFQAGESRGDIVTVSPKDVAGGLLPDVCLVCGQHSTDRVQKSIQYQSKFAQACMFAGFVLGGIPGVIIAIATVRDIPVACPVCPTHRNHWRRLTLLASIGWLIPVLLGGTGFLLGYFATAHSLQPSALAIWGLVTGVVLGAATYLIPVIYMATTNAKCEQTSDNEITFSRVSPAFARAVRSRKS